MNKVDEQELIVLKHAMEENPGILGTLSNSFMKFDTNKPMFDLIDPYWHEDTAKVLTMGATKYAKDNWKLNTEIGRYIAAMERHLIEIKKAKFKDKESKLQHTTHIACNSMFLHYMIKNSK